MTENVTVKTPDSAAMLSEADSAYMMATTMVIGSPALYELAASDLKDCKARIKQLDDERKAITKPLDDAKKRIMDLFKQPIDRLTQAETTIKSAMLDYQREEARKAAAEQAKAEAAAAAERARAQAEARKAAEAAAKLAAEAAESDDVELQAEAAAAAVEAEVMQETSQVITAPVIQTAAPKVAGVSTRVSWSAEVTDLLALAKYVVSRPEMADLIMPNQKALNSMAIAMKDKLAIDGVKAVPKETISSR